MKVLFRHTFPKQPATRLLSVILWMNDKGRYAVHNEYHDDHGGRDCGTYTGENFPQALEEYNRRCSHIMKFYQSVDGWARTLTEL